MRSHLSFVLPVKELIIQKEYKCATLNHCITSI